MTEQGQEVQWAPIPPKPSNPRRIWLIVGLAIGAIVIVGLLLFFLLPRGESADPEVTASPTPSASPSSTSAPTTEPEPEPEPSTPVTAPPPAADPDIATFRERVGVWLDTAPTGLDIVSETETDEALSVIDTLQADAQRLADSVPPSSIATAWTDGVDAYFETLGELRSAVESGTGVSAAVESTRSAVDDLRGIVDL